MHWSEPVSAGPAPDRKAENLVPDEPWLSSPASSELELNTDLLGEVLREYRRVNKINQADLAQLLHLDQSYVSKIETGKRRVTDIEMLLRIAQQLNVPPARLGLSDELLRPVADPSGSRLVGDVDPVAVSQEKWRRTRRALNRSRRELAQATAGLYRPDVRVGDLTFLALPQWTPAAPIPLDEIRLDWLDNPPPVSITGSEPEAASTLPLRAPGKSFPRYTSAVRYLDPPKLFENRTSYRLLEVDLRDDPHMKFGLAAYFDKLDLAEAIAHEAAMAHAAGSKRLNWDSLPLRALIGDPFDMERRYIIPAIETLTLRRNRKTGEATFLLHWRDPAKVATSAGIYGLIPAGEFQPSTVSTHDRENDFSLWRSMVREYSEEILGEPERDGSSGEPLVYEDWPLYKDLERARQNGRVSPYCLGIGLDTLTLTATILTVVVFDDDAFDELFGDAVSVNSEGSLVSSSDVVNVTDGLRFNGENVLRLLRDEPVASPGACILRRAYDSRDFLLR
jgi:transcriptional regulator with XRE-family HTH domain